MPGPPLAPAAALLVALAGCLSPAKIPPPRPASPASPPPVESFVRLTPTAAVACPVRPRDLPVSLCDVDGDGRLDRVAVTRAPGGFAVRVLASPELTETRSLHVDGEAIEVAVARWSQGTRGDLWIYVMQSREARPEQVLYRLDEGALVEAWRGPATRREPAGSDEAMAPRLELRIDVDGDGRADPIFGRGGGSAIAGAEDEGEAVVLLDGLLRPIAGVHRAQSIHGMPAAHGLEEAVDLDGDGERDVLAVEDGQAKILGLPSFRTRFVHAATGAAIVRFGGRPALFVRSERGAEIFAADAAHTRLLGATGLRYATPLARVDPAGDGSILALDAAPSDALFRPAFTGLPAIMTRVGPTLGLQASPPPGPRDDAAEAPAVASAVSLDVDLAGPADGEVARLGPVPLRAGGPAELVGVRTLSRGSLAGFTSDGASYELVVRPPPGLGRGRTIGHGRLTGRGGAAAELVDLEGDGVYEILLHEDDAWLSRGDALTGGQSRLLLLRGDGHVLWQDRTRPFAFAAGHPEDERARARALDLFGDGTRALQIRTPSAEWYVLPRGSTRGPIPPCVE